jgi:hypothetical protein
MFLRTATVLVGLLDLIYAVPLTTQTSITVDLGYTVQEGLLEVRLYRISSIASA